MSEIVNFIQENLQTILIIIIFVFGLLVIININDLDLNSPISESKLVQEVTVETLDMMDEEVKLNLADSFCKSYLGKTTELEGGCNQLTKTNCEKSSCCIFTDKCVAGGLDGPTYKTDNNGKLITIDTYYYLGKCKGKCQ